MLRQTKVINPGRSVYEIVANDYRTADVFRKYDITYCCGGKFPLQITCESMGIDSDKVQQELENASRTISISNSIDFYKWEPGFLLDYILNVHHHYLTATLSGTQKMLVEFIDEHAKKYPYLDQLAFEFNQLTRSLQASMFKEEQEIFPYVRQIAHAYKHQEPYAGLFIRTLRKPVEDTLLSGHSLVSSLLLSIRELTGGYNPPANACLNHKVILSKLKELDNDLVQHLYLEQEVLFPKVHEIEKELTKLPGINP